MASLKIVMTSFCETMFVGNYLGAVKRWGEELTVENRLNKEDLNKNKNKFI